MWEAIRSNKRKSLWLIVLMAVVLAALGGAIGAMVFPEYPEEGIFFGVFIAMVVWIVMMITSVAGGERILLATAGAREIAHEDAPQLFNIVEEMKIASGLPAMPRVFIMDSSVPNAFAVGLKPERAAVAVTTGLMARLNRDELQGVIAHEIGHIANRDTMFLTLAGVTVGAVILLADLFLRGMWYSSFTRKRSSKDNDPFQLIIMVVSIVLAIVAPILTQILYFATSRQREYLADASSARFTRYPEGLASALEKISAGQSAEFNKSRALAPMYIVNPLAAAGKQASLMSTHPPTDERIQILRGMSGGSSLGSYEQAYRKLKQSQGLFSPKTLAADQQQGTRPATAPAHDAKKGMRDIKDVLHRINGYGVLACGCGMKMKIPKAYRDKDINCPRCGKKHHISTELLSSIIIAAEQT